MSVEDDGETPELRVHAFVKHIGMKQLFAGLSSSSLAISRCFANDDIQLGNYLGLFQPFLELQRTSAHGTPLYLSIVGLHAITLPQNPAALREDRLNMLASLIACGVDVDRTKLFFQEDVSHPE
jgi:tryptophanyl-tRNA synthetase